MARTIWHVFALLSNKGVQGNTHRAPTARRSKTPGRAFMVLADGQTRQGFFDLEFLRDHVALIEYQQTEF